MSSQSAWDEVTTDISSNETSSLPYDVESGNSRYQIESFATISSSGESSYVSAPSVTACYRSDFACVAVDCHLMIFKNSGRSLVAKLDFASLIDDVACSEDGSIVVAGNRSGDVYVIDGITGEQIISRQLEVVSSNNEKPFYTKIQFGAQNLLLLLTQSNNLHIVDGIGVGDMAKLKHAVIQTYGAIWITMTLTGDIVTAYHNSISVWHRSDPLNITTYFPRRVADNLPISIQKFAVACNDTLLIVSDTKGRLTLWSVDMLVTLSILDSPPVDNFVILDCPMQSNRELTALLAAVTLPGDNGIRKLLVYTLPNMASVYSIPLASFVTLAMPASSSECLFLVEGLSSEETPSSSLSCLRLSCLSETNPETRLSRLLQKERFSDAESLAKMFGLDIQLVYRARVSQLLDSLSPWKVATMDDITVGDLVKQLIFCLGEIKDAVFVIDSCMSTAMPNIDGVTQLFSLANRRLLEGGMPQSCITKYKMNLAEIEYRFVTFQVLLGSKCYSGDSWRNFICADMSIEFCKLLSDGQIRLAAVLWDRHGDELRSKLVASVGQLEALLAKISDTSPLVELCRWFVDGLIPHLLRSDHCRSLISALAVWIEHRATDLEVTDKAGWPTNALQLCEALSCNVDRVVFKCSTPCEYAARVVGLSIPRLKLHEANVMSSPDPLVRLHVLVNDLQRLLALQNTYDFGMPLEAFRAETVRSVAFRMLDRVVAIELVHNAVVKTIRPYASASGLDPDELLASYVEDLANRRGIGGWHLTATWESKSLEVIQIIVSKVLRHRALMAVLTNARFPWADDVAAAVKEATAANPNDASLLEKCRMASFKQLLISYDLRAFNVAEVSRAEDLAFYIIKQDRETAVADALEVIEFYGLEASELHLFRCRFLAENDRSVEIVQLLSQLSTELACDISERFVCLAMRLASMDILCERRRQYLLAACNVLRCRLRGHLIDNDLRAELQHQLEMLESIYALQTEFNINMSVGSYCSKQQRDEFFTRYEKMLRDGKSSIGVLSSGKNNVHTEKKPNVRRAEAIGTVVYRLAEVLKIGRDQLRMSQANNYAVSGQLNEVVRLLKNIKSSILKQFKKPALSILQVIRNVCVTLSELPVEQLTCTIPHSILADIYELSCWSLAFVDANMIHDTSQFCRAIRLAAELLEQCDAGDFGASLQKNFDAYMEWTFDDFLSDDDGGLVMDAKLVQPTAFEFIVVTSPDFEVCPRPCSQFRARKMDSIIPVATKIHDLLRSNSQTRLFLAYMLETASHVSGSIPAAEQQSSLTSTLKRVISQRRADYRLGLACLCSLPTQFAYDTLSRFAISAGVQYKRALSVALLGLQYTILMNDPVAHSVAENTVAEAWWGYRLAKLRISFRDAFSRGREEKKGLIPTFARCPSISVSDVVEYCAAFKLNTSSDAMVLYLKCLLIPLSDWEGSDIDNCQGNSSVSVVSVLARAEEACSQINWHHLSVALEDILDKLSPTDYERIGFVLGWLERILNDPNGCDKTIATQRSLAVIERDRKLLTYLQRYKRISPPGEGELSADSGTTERLPFHQITNDHWRIITPELTADTVHVWVPVASLFNLPADQVYTTAIRNIVQTHVDRQVKNPTNGFHRWHETSVDTKLFRVVDHLLSCIVGTDLAVACVGWIARVLPPGAEKVLASRSCVAVAQRWVSSCKPSEKQKAVDALNKYSVICRQISIEQILHTNGLAEADLLALVSSPARLVFRLYEHPTIVEQIRCQIRTSQPDIHMAVDQIATVGLVDARKIRLTLLDRWLPSRHARQQQEAADVTMNGEEAFSASGVTDGLDVDDSSCSEEEIDLMRAIYILEHHDQSANDAALYLIRFALEGEKDVHTTSMCQVRALRCLLSLVDLDDLERLSQRSGWRERLTAMLYDGELKRLRVLATSESFERLDKSALARAVCRSRDPGAARVAACLAVDFCRNDSQLWAGILNRLSIKEVGIALRSLPWRGREIASAIVNIVSSNLSAESLSSSVAADLCCLIQRLSAPVDSKTLHLWATRFLAFRMPERALACRMLMTSFDTNAEEFLAE